MRTAPRLVQNQLQYYCVAANVTTMKRLLKANTKGALYWMLLFPRYNASDTVVLKITDPHTTHFPRQLQKKFSPLSNLEMLYGR